MSTTIVKAVGYARISLDQAEDAHGIASQRALIERMAEERGLTLVRIFEDNDISASRFARKPRPAYQEMLQLIALGDIDVLIARDVDRILRRISDSSSLMELLNSVGCQLVTHGGKIDPSTSEGKLMLSLGSTLAEIESDKTSARMRHAQRDRRSKGLPSGGSRPFGYLRPEPNVLVVNEDERALVVEVFDRFLAGKSMRSTATLMNERGLLTNRGNKWSTSTVQSIIESGVSAGHQRDRVDTGAWRRGTWEPIIDETTWRAALDILDSRRKGTNTRQPKNLLVGVTWCGLCAARIGAYVTKGYRYYACRSGCKNSINRDKADAFVLSMLRERIESAQEPEPITPSGDPRADLEALIERRQSMAVLVARGEIDQAEWVAVREALLSDERSLRSQIAGASTVRPTAELLRIVDDGTMAERSALIRNALPGMGLLPRHFKDELTHDHFVFFDVDDRGRPITD